MTPTEDPNGSKNHNQHDNNTVLWASNVGNPDVFLTWCLIVLVSLSHASTVYSTINPADPSGTK